MVLMICSFIHIILELFVLVGFIELFFDFKPAWKRLEKKLLLITVLVIISSTVSILFNEQLYIKLGLILVIYVAGFKLTMKISVLPATILSLVLYEFITVSESLLMYFVATTNMFGTECNTIVVLLIKSVLYVISLYFINNNRGKFKNIVKQFSILEWSTIGVVAFVTILILIYTADRYDFIHFINLDPIILIIVLTVGLLDVAVFILFIISMSRKQYILQSEAVLDRVRNETELYRSLSENLEKQRRKTHEFDNQINAIQSLLEQDKITELKKYVSDISEKYALKVTKEIRTGHTIINSILATKYEEAVSRNIAFFMKLNDLSLISMKDEDIVILLSNLLNNAISACEKAEDKILKVKFVIEDNQIILSVKNTLADIPKEMDGELITSKDTQSEEHGIGLKNVKEVVEKYHGRYVVNFDDKWFSFSMIIRM